MDTEEAGAPGISPGPCPPEIKLCGDCNTPILHGETYFLCRDGGEFHEECQKRLPMGVARRGFYHGPRAPDLNGLGHIGHVGKIRNAPPELEWNYRNGKMPGSEAGFQAFYMELKRLGKLGWELCGWMGAHETNAPPDDEGHILYIIKRPASDTRPTGLPEGGGYVLAGTGEVANEGPIQVEEAPKTWGLKE